MRRYFRSLLLSIALSPAALAGIAAEVNPNQSACGLPSNVVIDMAKATVQRTDAEWKAMLTPMQFRVARQQGT